MLQVVIVYKLLSRFLAFNSKARAKLIRIGLPRTACVKCNCLRQCFPNFFPIAPPRQLSDNQMPPQQNIKTNIFFIHYNLMSNSNETDDLGAM